MVGRHSEGVHGDRCAGGCGRHRVTFPIMRFGQEGLVRTIKYRTCGEPDCEVLADLEQQFTDEPGRR